MDDAEALGLAVVVDIPLPKFVNDPEFYEKEELFLELKEKIGKTVSRHRNHPALLYWNLGNELYYPYLHVRTTFFENYNKLIDLIHEIDPNHPVSTTTIGANKSRVLTIITRSPQLDFISFNSFGILSQFEEKIKPISPVWKGPHVISEWGVNGPWEAALTSWSAPIEETSTKKAEQIKERHQKYIAPLKEINSLGSFIFYWSKKNEITPTWYSLFGEDHLKTQAVFELTNIWKNTKSKIFPGPEIEYLLINNEGAFENITLPPGLLNYAEVVLPDGKIQDPDYRWEIRHESWDQFHISKVVPGSEFESNGPKISFKTPKKEGPYRLFVYLTNNTGYVATANVPFYVLKPEDGK